jgi:TolB protein
MIRLACLFLFVLSAPLRAELVIEITQGRDNPTSIAVVPFAWSGWGAAPEDVAGIVGADLLRSGQFAPVARGDMLSLPTRESDVFYRDWRATDVEYLLIGRVQGGSTMTVEYELFDVYRQDRVLTGSISTPAEDLRMVAHRIADDIYEQLTGIPGAFATRILYIAVTERTSAPSTFRLTVADADGARSSVLFESNEPILSPAWSPDGKTIAYVSFETTRPAIFLQNLETGERQQLTNYPGLNGAPAFSPDGTKLALTLSKDGSPDIYILDLATRQLERVTRHYAIDTEPAWMPDGRSIVFTSDRGGRPQIYEVDLPTGRTERLTHEGPWNARASLAADGRTMVMVQQTNNQFHIAVQDILRGRVQKLTTTTLDESPSVAPNGSMLLYATKYEGRGILAAVSVDGGVKFRLPSREGDVREPAWSPYLGDP